MRTQFRFKLAILTLTSTLGLVSAGDAQTRTREDTLAADLKWQAADITWDLHDNYRANPDFPEVYREMYDLLQGTKIVYQMIYDDSYHVSNPALTAEISGHLRNIDERLFGIYQVTANWVPDDPQAALTPEESLPFKVELMAETLAFLMDDQGITECVSFGVFCPTGIVGRNYIPRRQLWGHLGRPGFGRVGFGRPGFGRPGFGRYPRGGLTLNFRFGGRPENRDGHHDHQDGRTGDGDGRPVDQDRLNNRDSSNHGPNSVRNLNGIPRLPIDVDRVLNQGRPIGNAKNTNVSPQDRLSTPGNFRSSSRFQNILQSRGNSANSNRGAVIRGQSSNRSSTNTSPNGRSFSSRLGTNSNANSINRSNNSSGRSGSSFRSNTSGIGSSVRGAVQSNVRNFSNGNRGFSGGNRGGNSNANRNGGFSGGNRGGGNGRSGR